MNERSRSSVAEDAAIRASVRQWSFWSVIGSGVLLGWGTLLPPEWDRIALPAHGEAPPRPDAGLDLWAAGVVAVALAWAAWEWLRRRRDQPASVPDPALRTSVRVVVGVTLPVLVILLGIEPSRSFVVSDGSGDWLVRVALPTEAARLAIVGGVAPMIAHVGLLPFRRLREAPKPAGRARVEVRQSD